MIRETDMELNNSRQFLQVESPLDLSFMPTKQSFRLLKQPWGTQCMRDWQICLNPSEMVVDMLEDDLWAGYQ